MLKFLRESINQLNNETETFGIETLREKYDDVDEALQDVESVLGSLQSWEAPLAAGVATHLVTAGGKRLRPALMFLCYGAAGGDDLSEVRPYAVGSELIHTATLLHDDVIDEGDIRRGEPTANSVYGKSNAVLSGDYLVAHVINELHQLEHSEPVEKLSEVMTRLIQGEILQDELSGNPDMNHDQYLRVVRLKTSSLFTYSAWCGGYLPDQNQERAEAFSDYAENLGIAFQMIDDVLDFQSGESGKTPLADLRDGTINYPLLLAFQDNMDLRQSFHRTNFEEDPDPDFLDEVRQKLREVEAMDRTRETAREYSSRARACIENVTSNSFTVALEQLADYVFRRIK